MGAASLRSPFRLFAMACALALVSACAGGRLTEKNMAPVIAPQTYDVILTAAKEGQFDYMEAPLTPADLRAALNYRKEQNLPMKTVLLKRGEKARIKDTHIVALARIAVALGFTAYLQDDNEINEIRTTTSSDQ
ncbi:MAG: hypothetical protein EYC71_14040 [Gammaproteobacteria bacterium]|nr:MAG: hypothetical protein EYC71_14040 [Gammaproteobacteria bacterium]